ncbi:putative metal-binding motif-containing protein [Pyxidicoccus sp. 3LG]
MRLFLVGVLLVAVSISGCRKEEDPPSAGALRVLISYATFQARCLTLTVVDLEDPSRTESTEVQVVADVRSDTRTVAVLGREGWSRNLRLTATAHERSCSGPRVAEQSLEVQVPAVGVSDANLALRAEDLDNDMYVAAEGPLPGTDCDDSDAAVHPNAAEPCDGIDNNCASGEDDAPGTVEYYADRDGDGYGDRNAPPVPYCVPPADTAMQAGDCDDGDATVHPDQEEFRCDGRDEDCDGVADNDGFEVGASCEAPLRCPGVKTCQGPSSSACVGTQEPEPAWYVDEDGDTRVGTDVGPGCTAPVPGATTTRTDCDESSRFAANDLTEVCDRLDNDCNGQTDEGLGTCAATPWTDHREVGGTEAVWNAVAP